MNKKRLSPGSNVFGDEVLQDCVLNRAVLLGYDQWQRCCSTFMYGPVSLQKIRFEENLKEVSRQALNGFIYWEDMDLFPVLDVRAGMNTVIKHQQQLVNSCSLFHRIFSNLTCDTKTQV